MNKGFQFKQFYISQSRCAMKVSETACLFGAFVPLTGKEQTILDIGTGTGLLSFMLAQRSSATICAIELDPQAVEQAQCNVQQSKFANQIQVIEADIVDWAPPYCFDLIICNPPFFEQQLPSENEQKQMAWHSSHLSLFQLISLSKKALSANGVLALLLPIQRMNEAEELGASVGLKSTFKYTLQHSENHAVKHVILGLSNKKETVIHERRLVIRETAKQYSQVVFNQLQPFYSSL